MIDVICACMFVAKRTLYRARSATVCDRTLRVPQAVWISTIESVLCAETDASGSLVYRQHGVIFAQPFFPYA